MSKSQNFQAKFERLLIFTIYPYLFYFLALLGTNDRQEHIRTVTSRILASRLLFVLLFASVLAVGVAVRLLVPIQPVDTTCLDNVTVSINGTEFVC